MYDQLKSEFDYYVQHQADFVSQYNGKVIALKNHKVLGVYADEWEAVKETEKEHEKGTFIVQRVTPGSEAYTVTIATNFVAVA